MNDVLIRDETIADATAVDALIRAAFAGMPYSDGSEPRVMAALRDAGAAVVALVADESGAVVAQAAFSAVTVDGRQSGWHGLGPVSVRPDRQRRGLGSALVRSGLDRLRALGSTGCVVLGDTGYYARFGFRRDSRMTAPGLPAEHFMVLPFGDAAPAGAVAYHPAFTVGP